MVADPKGAVPVLDLDSTLDDIEDLPGFGVFHSGAYRIVIDKLPEQKLVGTHQALEVVMKCEEIMEQTEAPEAGEKLTMVGDIMSLAFMLDNKFGQASLKSFMQPVMEKLGVAKISQAITQMKGMQLLVVVKRTYNSEKDQHYGKVKKLSVL